jgi:hypothetical protein
MSNTWMTNIQHFLDEDGNIAPIDGPARRIAEYFGVIISCATSPGKDADTHPCKCRRRPGRKKCAGLIETDIDRLTNDIFWQCPLCHDNGRISHWQGTQWDKRKMNDR